MRYMLVKVDGCSQGMLTPSDRAELERLKYNARAQGFIVIAEVDTSGDPGMEPMLTTIMVKRRGVRA